jgi:hypothetical protein
VILIDDRDLSHSSSSCFAYCAALKHIQRWLGSHTNPGAIWQRTSNYDERWKTLALEIRTGLDVVDSGSKSFAANCQAETMARDERTRMKTILASYDLSFYTRRHAGPAIISLSTLFSANRSVCR